MHPKNALLAGASLMLALAAPLPAAAQMTVYDPTNSANMINSISQLKAQLDQMKQVYDTTVSQLNQARQSYESATGSRNLGDVFSNPLLRKYLPQDYRRIYDRAQVGGYSGISGTIDQVLKSEALNGTVAEQQQAIAARRRASAATNRLIGQDGFDGAEARLQQLDQLQSQISATQDPKAIAELQARIQIEQANIQAEATKLQLLSQLAKAEEQLAAEQRRELSAKILNPRNTNMGRIQ